MTYWNFNENKIKLGLDWRKLQRSNTQIQTFIDIIETTAATINSFYHKLPSNCLHWNHSHQCLVPAPKLTSDMPVSQLSFHHLNNFVWTQMYFSWNSFKWIWLTILAIFFYSHTFCLPLDKVRIIRGAHLCWWEAATGMLKTCFVYKPLVNEGGQELI